MKSLFRVTLLVAAVVVGLNTAQVSAAEPSKPTDTVSTTVNSKFRNDDQQSAYALGASLGRYMENSLKEQEKLGIKLDGNQLIAGVQDAFSGKSKLNDEEIEKTLQGLETRVKALAQAKTEQEAKENAKKGQQYRDKFIKERGVEKTTSGLLYKVEQSGDGAKPKNSDTVVVNYKGTLTDGTEFDNSHARGEPLSFRLDGVIPGWTEGLKHIRKGGKIKLVIPPELAYGKMGVPGIPANSTLIFDVELLDIKAAPTAEDKTEKKAPAESKLTAK